MEQTDTSHLLSASTSPVPPEPWYLSWPLRFWCWVLDTDGDGQPLSITTAKRSSKLASVSRLYILNVDHPIGKPQAEDLEKALDPLREKYGIDFFVLEPGMKLSRFEDI